MTCKISYIQAAPLSDTEKIRLEEIHVDLFRRAKDSKSFRAHNNKLYTLKDSYQKATQFVSQINNEYKAPITRIEKITPSQSFLFVDVLPLSKEKQNSLFSQLSEDKLIANERKIIQLSKDLLTKMGVDYKIVKDIYVNGRKLNANGVADILGGLVQVTRGKEYQALPEETMHFVTEILEQTNSQLFNKLLKEINDYRIYSEVLAVYSKDPFYTGKDGKPDIRKLKKEAIAKQLVNTIINKIEGNERPELVAKSQSWWKDILDFIKSLFVKSGFDQAALDILSGKEIGTIEDLRNNDPSMSDIPFLQKNTAQSLFDKLKQVASTVEKKDESYYVNGKKVPRVSDIVHDWYGRRFAEKSLTKSEYEQSVDNLKAEKGTAGHNDIQHAFSLFVDENGDLRETPLEDSGYISQLNPKDSKMYNILKENLKERLNSFPKGTKFLSEITVYNQRRNIAGTMDFVAITPEGKVSILDWKFMDLNTTFYKDIPWYKVNAWNLQMEQYKLILEGAYGVKNQDFQQTRMIPIKATYSYADRKKGELPRLTNVQIGSVNVKEITEDYLLPVGLEGEKTGNRKIDALIEKLNAVYKKFSEKKALPEEKLSKAEQLNALFTAIRQLQIKGNLKPLLYQAKVLNKQIQTTIEKFEKQWKGKDPKDFTQKEISNFAEELETAQNSIVHYTTLDVDLSFLFSGELTKEDKELRDDLRDVVDNARILESNVEEVSGDFADQFVAGSEEVNNILAPEKIIKGITKWFSSTATLQLKAMEVLYKKANRAFAHASMDTLDETKKLNTIKESYDKWATKNNLTQDNYFNILKKPDKNQLIDQFKVEFYKELKSKVAEKDLEWIKANVDMVAYKTHLNLLLDKETQRILDKPRVGTEQEVKEAIEREIKQAEELYNISQQTSPGWSLNKEMAKFPVKEKWETNEWKELHKAENKPALEFYNYIKERNEYYTSIGYIHGKQTRIFLPYVRKGLMEKIVTGKLGEIKLGEQFLRDISIDEGDVGYGKIDPLTGRLIDTVPIYFTKEIEGPLSNDLFRNMALFNEMAIRYKYVSDIEAQARALVNVERNKKAIATSIFGKTVYKDGRLEYTPDNNENSKLLEDMVKGIIYGQRYIQSETFDQMLTTFGKTGEKLNEKLGVKLFPENLEGRQVSINKVLTQLNNTFQLNALGLNPLSALSNFLGGSFQSIINSGKYFTKTDFTANELWLMSGKMIGKDQKKYIGALEYFLPLTDNYNREIAKTLSLSKLSQENIQEFLMIMMRKSDWLVQTTNFYAFLENSIVQDGKVVNAREYLREQPEYQDMFGPNRSELTSKFETEVRKLIEEKGVMKLGKIENNEFVIPGIDRKSQSVVELRRKVQQLSKDALGNLSEDDLRVINMNIYGKSFMLFKNWIPRPVDVRIGNLKYNSASDAYEWGRMRMVARLLLTDGIKSIDSLKSALTGDSTKWVDQMKSLYDTKKEEYEKETGKTLEMSENEFLTLVTRNVRAQVIDAIFMLTLFSLYLGLKAFAPDDEEDEKVKNVYKYTLRAVDKIKDELWFFYDPTSLMSLVSTGIFPSIAYLNNLKRLLINFGVENFAILTGDDELQEDTHVIKYLLKSFPVANQAQGMLPMFYPELAKDLGIRMGTQSRMGR